MPIDLLKQLTSQSLPAMYEFSAFDGEMLLHFSFANVSANLGALGRQHANSNYNALGMTEA